MTWAYGRHLTEWATQATLLSKAWTVNGTRDIGGWNFYLRRHILKKAPETSALTCNQVHDPVLIWISAPLQSSSGSVYWSKVRTKSTESKLGICKIFFYFIFKSINSFSRRRSDFSYLVSEGFCLTRNFLFGIPISAALTQRKNKDTQTMYLEGRENAYWCDVGWQKQIIYTLPYYSTLLSALEITFQKEAAYY